MRPDEPDPNLPHEPRERRTLIGWRTATACYAMLVAASFAMLKGKALILGLIIVGGLAAKSYVHFLRERSRD